MAEEKMDFQEGDERKEKAYRVAPVHPGEIIWRRFIKPMGLNQTEFSQKFGIEKTKLNRILNGSKDIDIPTSRELGRALNVNPRFFLDLQINYLEAKENRPDSFNIETPESHDGEQNRQSGSAG